MPTDDDNGLPPKPGGFLAIQLGCIFGFVALGLADLWTPDTVVPWMVYAGLAAIAGGPEMIRYWPGGKDG